MKARIALVPSALCLVALASCVELTGQRIVMRYDDANDELQVLFFHDGIHESPPSRNEEGAQQIEDFAANGDLMFLDWFCYLPMKDARSFSDSSSPALGALAAAVASSVRSTPVGRYRDVDGRVGAAQLVVVSHARVLIGKINAAIGEAVQKQSAAGGGEWPMTLKRMAEAARDGRGREWLSIDGHSLRFRFPAQPAEWARGKAAFVKAVIDGWQEAKEGKSNDNRPAFFLQLLALSPVSIEESSEGVSIRLGDPKRPLPLRFAMRDVYNAKLEPSVAKAAPVELDEVLARRLLAPAGARADSGGVEAVAAWGPPEDAARALIARASSADAAARAPALERLRSLGDAWNTAGSLPPAPAQSADPARYLDAWKEWYRGVLKFPEND